MWNIMLWLFLIIFKINAECTYEEKPVIQDDWTIEWDNTITCTNISLTQDTLNLFLKYGEVHNLLIMDSDVPIIRSAMLENFTNLTKIAFRNCGVVDIEPSAFKNLYNLTDLDISYNNLTQIKNNSLNGISKLNHLNLAYNKLKSVQYINQISIDFLNISNNLFENLNENDFDKMKNVQYLNISHNKFSNITPNLFENFSNLIKLCVANNSIKQYSIVLENLETLDLSFNLLETVEIQNKTFALTWLHLKGNKLNKLIEGQFRLLKHLRALILGKNFIRDIDVNAFENLQNLYYLDLSENQITTIHPGTFRHTPSLDTLVLADNDIETLEIGSFTGLDYLLELHLNNNRLHVLDLKVFYSIRGLQKLYLHGNFLEDFDSSSFKSNFKNLNYFTLNFKQMECNTLVKILRRLNSGNTYFPSTESSYDEKVNKLLNYTKHNVNGIVCDPDIKEVNNDIDSEYYKLSAYYFHIVVVLLIFALIASILIFVMKILSIYNINFYNYYKTRIFQRKSEHIENDDM